MYSVFASKYFTIYLLLKVFFFKKTILIYVYVCVSVCKCADGLESQKFQVLCSCSEAVRHLIRTWGTEPRSSGRHSFNHWAISPALHLALYNELSSLLFYSSLVWNISLAFQWLSSQWQFSKFWICHHHTQLGLSGLEL